MTAFLDDRPKPVRSLSRFLIFAIVVVIAVSGLTARLFYLQIVDGGRLATLATRNRTVLEAIRSPRGLIYDRTGRVARQQRRQRSWSSSDQRTCRSSSGRSSSIASPPCSRMPPPDINATIDGNPGSTFDLVRIAERCRREHGPADLRGHLRPARSRGRHRSAPAVRRRPADVADPRLHGSRLRRAAPAN